MKPYEKIAVDFATALVESRYEDARQFLEPSLRKQFPAAKLKKQLHDMFGGYADGPATRIQFDPEFSMDDWPAKKEGDVGWVYVGIEGEGFLEAVTVVVSDASAGLAIREIDWGRP